MKLGDTACVIQGSGYAVGRIGAFIKAGKPIRRVIKRMGLEPKVWTVERGRWDRVILLTEVGYQTPRSQNIVKVTDGSEARPIKSVLIERPFLTNPRRRSVASGCVF